jgi:hypothetical protein
LHCFQARTYAIVCYFVPIQWPLSPLPLSPLTTSSGTGGQESYVFVIYTDGRKNIGPLISSKSYTIQLTPLFLKIDGTKLTFNGLD